MYNRRLAAAFAAVLLAATSAPAADPREGRYEPYILNVAENAFINSYMAYVYEAQSGNLGIVYARMYSAYGTASYAWDTRYTQVLAGIVGYDVYQALMASIYTDSYYAYLYAYAAYQDKKGPYTLAALTYSYYAQYYGLSAKSSTAPPAGMLDGNGLNSDLASLFARVNAARTQQSLSALTVDSRLNAAAQKHANWMAIHGTLTAAGAGGSSAGDRIRGEGYVATAYWQSIGAGYETDQLMMNAWMANTAQKAAILNSTYQNVGFGVARGLDSRRYWVAVYAKPKGG